MLVSDTPRYEPEPMLLPDLTEIGPDGEEWWVIDPYLIETGQFPAGHFTPLFFATLAQTMKYMNALNTGGELRFAPIRYRSHLARDFTIISPGPEFNIPLVHTWGKSKQRPSLRYEPDDIFGAPDDDEFEDDGP